MRELSIGRIATLFLVAMLLSLLTLPAYGQSIIVGKDKTPEASVLALPYAFFNQSFGGAAGFVYGLSGTPQKQMTFLATVIAGSDSAAALYVLSRNVQVPLPFTGRLFMDTDFALSAFGNIVSYSNGNPSFAGQQAGANNSSANNYIKGPGSDNLARVKFRFLLPMGNARNEVINTLVVDKGVLVEGSSGGESWNPFASGKTLVPRTTSDKEFSPLISGPQAPRFLTTSIRRTGGSGPTRCRRRLRGRPSEGSGV